MKSFTEILAETAKAMNNNEFNYTCNGICSNCGGCCSNTLPMTAAEISVIKQYIKCNKIKDISRNKGMCPFRYEGTKICTVYKARPQICKQFICDTNQRKPFSQTKEKFSIVNVRLEFFGGK